MVVVGWRECGFEGVFRSLGVGIVDMELGLLLDVMLLFLFWFLLALEEVEDVFSRL
jgi:hypothetical protein